MFGTITKNWYKINDEVEYSTNYRFFLEHQIFVSHPKHSFEVKVISRLDGKVLEEFNTNKHTGEIEGFELDLKLREIHKKLLKGEIYDEKGEFVN